MTLTRHGCCAQALLRCAAQCVHTYVRAATGAVAQGVAAAGIDVALPRKVGLLAVLLEGVSEQGGFPRALIEQHIPPFILDTWMSCCSDVGPVQCDAFCVGQAQHVHGWLLVVLCTISCTP